MFFTIAFAIELAINAYAHWFSSFVNDGWNAFDCIVVALSLIALGPVSMPINVLRSLRAFRVVRLFGRMGALRDIVSALTAAISPVLNAFLIMLIVGSICKSPFLLFEREKSQRIPTQNDCNCSDELLVWSLFVSPSTSLSFSISRFLSFFPSLAHSIMLFPRTALPCSSSASKFALFLPCSRIQIFIIEPSSNISFLAIQCPKKILFSSADHIALILIFFPRAFVFLPWFSWIFSIILICWSRHFVIKVVWS